MKIIRASKSHAEKIAKLNIFVQKIHNKAHPDIFKSYSDDEGVKLFFEKTLNDRKNYIFLAYLSDIPVGYLWAQIQNIPETPFNYSTKRIYIHQFGVDEKHKRRGVGTRLMDQVIKLSGEHKIRGIGVDTWTFNKEATLFYQRQGFDIYNYKMWRR